MSDLKPCQIDIMKVRKLCYDGALRAYIEDEYIYLKDTVSGEVVWIGDAPDRRAQPNQLPDLTKLMPDNAPLTLEGLREHYITCHDCVDAEYSRTVTCGYVCRSKSSPCRGRVTVGYDFCSYGRRKPEPEGGDHHA